MSTNPIFPGLSVSTPSIMVITMNTNEPSFLTKTIEMAAEEVNKRAKSPRDEFGLRIERKSLPYGDYTNGFILIERKTILDFVASIKDGRFNLLLKHLVEQPVPCVLLVNMKDVDKLSQVEHKSYSTMCAKLLHVGVQVMAYPSEFILMHGMVRIFQFGISNKRTEYNIDPPRHGQLDDPSKTVTARMLLAIPGMQESKAFKLAEKYSIDDLTKMTLEQLTAAMYEGKKKAPTKPSKMAHKIFLATMGRYASYNEQGEEDDDEYPANVPVVATSESENEINDEENPDISDGEGTDYLSLIGKKGETKESTEEVEKNGA